MPGLSIGSACARPRQFDGTLSTRSFSARAFALSAFIFLLLHGRGHASSLEKIPPPNYPTKVYFTITMTSLRKVDVVDQSFIEDFYLALFWRDDRLYDKRVNGGTPEEGEDFVPFPEFINTADGNPGLDLFYSIVSPALGDRMPGWPGLEAAGDSANETYGAAYGRKAGSFLAELDLRNFPFDGQNATIKMESSAYQLHELMWEPRDVERGLRPSDIYPSGWGLTGLYAQPTNMTYQALQESYHRMQMSIGLQREYGYYVSRVVANVILLVLMSAGAVFLGTQEADRLTIAQASFNGVVAWLFVLSAETPKLGYSTRLDAFTNASFGAIFAQFFFHAAMWGYAKWIDRAMPVGRFREDDEDSDDDDGVDEKAGKRIEDAQSATLRPQRPFPESPVASARGNPLSSGPKRQRGNSPSASGRRVVAPPPGVHSSSVSLEVPADDSSTASTPRAASNPNHNMSGLELYRYKGPMQPSTGNASSASTGNMRPELAIAAPSTSASAAPTTVVVPAKDKRTKLPRKKDWINQRRRCGTWPFSYYGEWNLWKARRRVDLIVTLMILSAYAIAVAIIIGNGITLTRPVIEWPR